MFFNNCGLTNVRLVQFEIKHFELVAKCLNQWRNINGLEIIVQFHSQFCLYRRSVSLPFGQCYFFKIQYQADDVRVCRDTFVFYATD